MVDTGASLVALRKSAAVAIGIEPKPGAYTAAVSTANGTVMAARVRLNEIAIGDITVYDVNALVLPDQALGQICSACLFCPGYGVTNMPTARWFSSNKPPHYRKLCMDRFAPCWR